MEITKDLEGKNASFAIHVNEKLMATISITWILF